LFGIVQGITEFLPVSSTAHIIMAVHLLGRSFPGLSFEIFLHLASVFAVILYFRSDVRNLISGFFSFVMRRDPSDRPQFFFGLYILVATVITGVLGVALKDSLDESLKSPTTMGIALLFTGAFLILIERWKKYGSRGLHEMTMKDALWVGLAQSIAIIPGISRSGATLIGGLWAGLDRELAVRYSFLLAIPVILGSSVLMLKDLSAVSVSLSFDNVLIYGAAFMASFVTSLVGIHWLISFLKSKRLIYFAIYCFFAATVCLFGVIK